MFGLWAGCVDVPYTLATPASGPPIADAKSRDIAAGLEGARALEAERDSARVRARAAWILAGRLQGQPGDCLAWHKADGACLGTIAVFNAHMDATAPPWQDVHPDSQPRPDTISARRRLALGQMLQDAFMESETPASVPGMLPVGPGVPVPDESRKRMLYAALEPLLFSARPVDRFRVSGATDTAVFRAWLAQGNLDRGLRKGAPPRGWTEAFLEALPVELAVAVAGLVPGACMGPAPAGFGYWGACRMPAPVVPAVPFAAVVPFLGERLASGAGIPRFDSAAVSAWLESHPPKAADTVRVRVRLTPKGGFPGRGKASSLPDTGGAEGWNTTLADLPPALARNLDSLLRAGAWRIGESLDCGEWPLGRWRVRLMGTAKGVGPGPVGPARARALAALRAPWLEAWDRERAAMAASAREAMRDRVRARYGYAPDSLFARAGEWAAGEAWVDSARIFGK